MRGPLELSQFENRFTELSQKQGSGAAVSEAWAFLAASAKSERKGMELKQGEDKGRARAMRDRKQEQAAQQPCDSSEGHERATWEQSAEEPRTPMARHGQATPMATRERKRERQRQREALPASSASSQEPLPEYEAEEPILEVVHHNRRLVSL